MAHPVYNATSKWFRSDFPGFSAWGAFLGCARGSPRRTPRKLAEGFRLPPFGPRQRTERRQSAEGFRLPPGGFFENPPGGFFLLPGGFRRGGFFWFRRRFFFASGWARFHLENACGETFRARREVARCQQNLPNPYIAETLREACLPPHYSGVVLQAGWARSSPPNCGGWTQPGPLNKSLVADGPSRGP